MRKRNKKTSDVPTRIYSFRVGPPVTEAERVEDQYRLAHQFRNLLVEIERRLRDGLRDAQLAHPEIGALLRLYEDANAAVENTYDDLRAAKSGAADPDLEPHCERLEAAKDLRDQFASELYEAKHSHAERLQNMLLTHPEIGPLTIAFKDAVIALKEAKDTKIPKEDRDRIETEHDRIKAELGAAKRALFATSQDALLSHPEIGPLMIALKDATIALKDAKIALKDAKITTEDRDRIETEHDRIKADLVAAKYTLFATSSTEDRDLALAAGYQHARDQAFAERADAQHVFIARKLCTGTYDRVKDAIKQAVKSTKRPPRFKSYDGTGSIGLQLIGGMTVSELHSCADTRLRLEPLPADYWQLPRNRRRHAARVNAWLRIGSNPDRTPIFAKFPVTFHRPLPKDAVIKWAYVVRKRIGRHYEWRLQLTIESETFRTPHQAVGEGTCAIDLGWRRLFDDAGNQIGLRAGYLVDETGHECEILVPEKLWRGIQPSADQARARADSMGTMAKVDQLAKTRSENLDTARDALVAWLDSRTPPEWMDDRITGLAQWRSPRKIQALVDAWTGIDWNRWRASRASGTRCNPSDFSSSANRVDGDTAILASLQAWARHDRHLQNYQEHLRQRLIAHRRETWRVLAAELTKGVLGQLPPSAFARAYAVILIENGTNVSEDREGTMKLPDIDGWERPDPEDGDPSEGREQRRMSRLAAPGELRDAIVKAASKTGARVEVEETVDSTRECAWCGSHETFDAAASLEHLCSSCGRTWDQDANACRNLLHRHGLPSGPVPPARPEVPAHVISVRSRSSSGSSAIAALDKLR